MTLFAVLFACSFAAFVVVTVLDLARAKRERENLLMAFFSPSSGSEWLRTALIVACLGFGWLAFPD